MKKNKRMHSSRKERITGQSRGLLSGFLLLCVLALLLCFPCGIADRGGASLNRYGVLEAADSSKVKDAQIPGRKTGVISFSDMPGTWKLRYRGNYGYTFRFEKNFRSMVVLYLHSHAIIFRGVYTIEGGDLIRINIYEMKYEKNVSRMNYHRGFVKTSSSHFLFQAEKGAGKKRNILILRPRRIIIDGRNSDGYFEPSMRLVKKG